MWIAQITDGRLFPAMLTACAIAVACAALSVPVVIRRWAFIGEGIGHSAFGGAGTAWLAAVLFPAMDNALAPYLLAVAFCIATALAIGWLSRRERMNADTAIGIFLVASLAWGFVAQQIYMQHFAGRQPAWFATLLFGQTSDLSGPAATAAVLLCIGVVLTVFMLSKEILAYCFDPTTAYTSGVRTGLVHYLLMVLIALVIVLGMRVVGSVLMTALLVLPGAIAMQLSRRLGWVMTIAIASALLAACLGLAINARWHHLPAGPTIVLTLVAEFAAAAAVSTLLRRKQMME